MLLHNDSKKAIDTVHLNVGLSLESGEESVEKASFLVMLAPGESKRVNVGLGRIAELTNKAHSSQLPHGSRNSLRAGSRFHGWHQLERRRSAH